MSAPHYMVLPHGKFNSTTPEPLSVYYNKLTDLFQSNKETLPRTQNLAVYCCGKAMNNAWILHTVSI